MELFRSNLITFLVTIIVSILLYPQPEPRLRYVPIERAVDIRPALVSVIDGNDILIVGDSLALGFMDHLGEYDVICLPGNPTNNIVKMLRTAPIKDRYKSIYVFAGTAELLISQNDKMVHHNLSLLRATLQSHSDHVVVFQPNHEIDIEGTIDERPFMRKGSYDGIHVDQNTMEAIIARYAI